MRGLCVGLRTFPPLVGRWYGPTHGESDGVGVGGLIGQSGRVAAAQEMAISGVSLPMMQRHGRWKTSAMPARYSERADTVLSGWARFELLRGNTKKEIGMDITINEVAGHLAFGLSACAYSMKKIVWLRAFALASLSLSLYYNLTLPSGVLWLVVFWLCVFLAINVFRITSEIINSLEASVSPSMKRVLAAGFPEMHTRDWHRITKKATISRYAPGEILLDVGQQTSDFCLLIEGETAEWRPDGRKLIRSPGIFWGELTYMLGDAEFPAGSPCRITAGPRGATVMRITYPDLRALASESERLRAALAEGIVRSAGTKHGLLEHSWENAQAAC